MQLSATAWKNRNYGRINEFP